MLTRGCGGENEKLDVLWRAAERTEKYTPPRRRRRRGNSSVHRLITRRRATRAAELPRLERRENIKNLARRSCAGRQYRADWFYTAWIICNYVRCTIRVVISHSRRDVIRPERPEAPESLRRLRVTESDSRADVSKGDEFGRRAKRLA